MSSHGARGSDAPPLDSARVSRTILLIIMCTENHRAVMEESYDIVVAGKSLLYEFARVK